MPSQEEFNKIAAGMEEVNMEMGQQIEEAAPMCHCRKMNFEYGGDYEEGSTEQWWECGVCGHQEDL